MPDAQAAAQAEEYLQEKMKELDSCGGIVECVITGMPVGVGEPVFDKLSANLGKAILSIGAVKGFEIGDGFAAAASAGSENNDDFYNEFTHIHCPSPFIAGQLKEHGYQAKLHIISNGVSDEFYPRVRQKEPELAH